MFVNWQTALKMLLTFSVLYVQTKSQSIICFY